MLLCNAKKVVSEFQTQKGREQSACSTYTCKFACFAEWSQLRLPSEYRMQSTMRAAAVQGHLVGWGVSELVWEAGIGGEGRGGGGGLRLESKCVYLCQPCV